MFALTGDGRTGVLMQGLFPNFKYGARLRLPDGTKTELIDRDQLTVPHCPALLPHSTAVTVRHYSHTGTPLHCPPCASPPLLSLHPPPLTCFLSDCTSSLACRSHFTACAAHCTSVLPVRCRSSPLEMCRGNLLLLINQSHTTLKGTGASEQP